MKISWHGHSCIYIETSSGHKIIMDPFISENPKSDLDIDHLKVDVILLTHAHNDHFGDTIHLARKNNALVVSTVEIADFVESLGVESFGLNIGGKYTFDFGTVELVFASHSSSLNYQGKNIPLGNPSGIIFEADGFRLYHAGDTGLFSDMKLIQNIDCAFLPIGDVYTMGIEDASQAAKWIQAKTHIPIHYNTFPLIETDPHKFLESAKPEHVSIPKIGEVIDLSRL